MKAVQIQEQTRLPLGKCIELVLSGVKYRLFRASITVAIIALATAFLMTMLSESVTARKVADAIQVRTAPRDRFLFWVARTSAAMTPSQLDAQLKVAEPDSARWREFKGWGKLSDTQLTQLAALATEQLDDYQKFFDELSEGNRRHLVGRVSGTEIFEWLLDEENFDAFTARMAKSDAVLDKPLGDFRQFLTDWKQTQPLRQAICTGHQAAVEAFARQAGGRAPRDVFAVADENLIEILTGAGMEMTTEDLEVVRQQASLSVDAGRIASAFNIPGVKSELAKRRDLAVSEVNLPILFQELDSTGGAEWFVELNATLADDASGLAKLQLSAERVRQVAHSKLGESQLSVVEATVSQDTTSEGMLGFSGRTLWLIAVSFLVCIVGIANAMLMSVTERFREIATMKCLGATDGFIMINFVLESVMQGIAGGVVGTALGFLLGAGRSWAKYGYLAIEQLPMQQILSVAGLSLFVGVGISAMAAVYPAWIAARLAPMEAMRIE